ncbi:orotidine-5'-phosphate decarboxylase [Desulfococcus multivorans]|uniref:Orotidine 5'-phosphate decarboxylase n=2 Tax=Desulfococcus TaxID=896 RepID=S7U549_DESML|nr:orotidine-5'-phosphate decarboxylase [Desulfococcus multivorans]AOY60241.1 PyrF: orotidine 5\'-phosphate decarboxylase [Desulfococcus multivorans]AQV02355.1 orotidine 5'-phosphate decarboxylase [Desulfococcus multivorans]EPR44631.1 Orotidine 5'-phosphate decarboxylase subfamily 1 core [Desulfococcus multivorans DSM 2059]SKA07483.1 orotidine-5'-phosphate decarboxylase [Desulfococcus multivorans DSM 2059]
MRSATDYIVFPLDVPSPEAAKEWVTLLSEEVGMFKVGLELFIQAGPDIVRFIRSRGARVFLDLKLHDIPATVARAMARVADLDVALATVHCGESPEMLGAAVAGSGGKVGVLGVTVLTSVSSEDIAAAGFRPELAADMTRLVMNRAETARAAGCAGIVCSGLEAAAVKKAFGPDFLAVTPGIRPASAQDSPDDQKRVTTPGQAVRWGADYLVVGRPIRDAADPREAARRIAREVQTALAAA